jgi:hypothetical protein
MIKKQQLEMGFKDPTALRPARVSRARRARVRWWFDQMRLVVDQAYDWSTPDDHLSAESTPIGAGRRC